MKHGRVVAQLSEDVEAIVAGLASALAHLEEWTGEYPGVSSGAPPASSVGVVPGDDAADPAGDVAVLTRVELLAVSGDPAVRHRLHLLGRLRASAVLARKTMASVDGVMLPVEFESESRDLAVLRWAVRRLRVDADEVGAVRLDKLARSVETTRRLVDQWQPPTSRAPSGCRLHRAAGDHVEVARDFRGAGLCRRCGEFRRLHEADPTPAILRAWSKGQKLTAGQIEDAVAAAKKKRRRKRRR